MKKEPMTTVTIPVTTLDKIKELAPLDRRGNGAYVTNLIEEKHKRKFGKPAPHPKFGELI